MPAFGQETKIGILLDTETTGLDHRKDEVIELGMVKFGYTPDGRIIDVTDTFSAFNESSEPIPAEITALTGITDENGGRPQDRRGRRERLRRRFRGPGHRA
jgi:DNA polymerase III subunit epsilon